MTSKSFTYNIHDLIRVRSVRRLPELSYFLTEEPLAEVDIEVRIASDPAAQASPDAITYQEVTGRYGFSIVINRSETHTEVVASTLIGMSPHVLYTNVVEPLLRWTFVRKGYALMHGACIAFGDKALFITAQTDTGKTTTILYTLRHNLDSCEFLSDDMTIFSRSGEVLSYPKPLTISQHTVQAMGGAPLTDRERLFLKAQSRLHSKGGRSIGMWLSDNKTPAATMSAVVQRLIPPPKFMVDRLVPGARYRDQAQLEHLVLIERGADSESPLSREDSVAILIANADDAYGFPPYPMLAHRLSEWNGEDLHGVERAIVSDAIRNVPAIRLRSSTYDWYKRLPQLVERTDSQAQAAR